MGRILSVLDYLENSCKKNANKVVFNDETTCISYCDFVTATKKGGTFLSSLCDINTPVAVLGEKSVKMLEVMFSAVYAGCFYVPLNVSHPVSRIENIINKLENPIIVVQKEYENLLPTNLENCKIVYFDDVLDNNIIIDENKLLYIRNRHIDVDPLYVMFTSGSTGVPKGIMVSHRSVIDFMEEFATTFSITEDDKLACQAPLDFDVSVKDIYTTLKVGASLSLIPKKMFSFPMTLIDYLEENKVTTLIWAASALCVLSVFNCFSYKVPSKINKVLFSGEAMPIKQLLYWQSYYKDAMFVNLYGPTEITCNCTYYILPKGSYNRDVIPIGKAFNNERVILIDEDDNLVTSSNKNGEICVSGTCLSLGYYKLDEESKRAFTVNPANKVYAENIYRTGDIGYFGEDGLLYFVGRKDFQIKRLGHRIELMEIENAIMSIENIKRCVCLYNQSNDMIYSFYIGDVKPTDIMKNLRIKLPAYMIPQKNISLDAFPITDNGKVDRKKLKEEYFND